MTSGIPFSKEEIEYIEQHSPNEFPSVIARGLAFHFRDYNGGYRSKESVIQIMRKIAEGIPFPAISEPKQDQPKDQTKNKTQKKLPDLRKGRPRKKRIPA